MSLVLALSLVLAPLHDPAGAKAHLSYIKAADPGFEDSFGRRVAVSGQTAVVAAHRESSSAVGVDGDPFNDGSNLSGAAFVFARSGLHWAPQAYLKASNTGPADHFGWDVDIDGDTIVVGAKFESSGAAGVGGNQADDSMDKSGAAYVFVRSGGVWTQQAYLKASNPDVLDLFGSQVAISGDTIAVAATGEDSAATGVGAATQASDTESSAGAVYIFRRTGTTWSQEAYLKAGLVEAGDGFGSDVALAGDLLVVGAVGEDSAATGVGGDPASNGATASGAAYVFRRTGTTWSQEAYLKAWNTKPDDRFGEAVAVDGATVVVGAEDEDSNGVGVDSVPTSYHDDDSGAAYVFAHDGTAWSQQAYLKASNTHHDDNFGSAVAISGDRVVVGAKHEDGGSTGLDGDQSDKSAAASGAAYLFERVGGTWSQATYIKASNTGAYDNFGEGVDVDGSSILVGASDEESASPGVDGDGQDDSLPHAGAAYAYELGMFHDCNANGVPDDQDLALGTSLDCNANGVPDECDILDAYLDIDGDGSVDSCQPPPLMADLYELSVASGGTQAMQLTAGLSLQLYLLMGTTSGTSPGTPSGTFIVPLNMDSYLMHTALHPNLPPLSGSFGLLSPPVPGPAGLATASVALPPAFSPVLVGVTLHHAFVTIDLTGGGLSSVSNAIPLHLLP